MAAKNAKRGKDELNPDINPDIPGLRSDLEQRENGGNDFHPDGPSGVSAEDNPLYGDSGTAAEDNPLSGGDSGIDAENNSLYKPDGDKQSKIKNLKGKFSKLSNKKWLVGGMLGTGGFLVGLLILLVIIAGSLKLPNLAAHITTYQFARVARDYTERTAQLTAEDVAVSTADKNALQKLHAKYSGVKDKTWGSMWDKINNYRADKVYENLKTSGTLDFKYERGGATSLWKKKLTAIVINGNEIKVTDRSAFGKLVHPLQARSERLALSAEVNQNLAVATQSRGVIIRGGVAKALRDDIGIKLKWWNQRDYAGLTDDEAKALQQKQAVKTINETETAPSKVSQIKEGEDAAQKALQECMDNPACVDETVKNGGQLPGTVRAAITKAVSADVFQKAVGAVNTTYAVALPVCMIYDGSLQSKSGQGEAIDNEEKELTKTFYSIPTAADQQKTGDTNGEAVNAMNWKVGDNVEDSIPEKRAAGVDVNTTADDISPQASASGEVGNQTTIFSFLPFGSDLANGLADKSCPLVTNIWFGAGVGVGTLILGFFTGGTSEVAEQGLARSIGLYLKDFAQTAFTKKEGVKLGLTTAGIVGATLYAQHLVAEKAALTHSGVAVGNAYVDDADKGGNSHAQQVSRGYMGRPMSYAEVKATDPDDKATVVGEAKSKSVFQRYLALDNADSLLNRTATLTASTVNTSAVNSIFKLGANILTPMSHMPSLFGGLGLNHAAAAGAVDTANYGQVQFGWSRQERNLIKFNDTFGPLTNQQILEASGQSDAIESKYGVCFDTKTHMGDLLTGTDPKIARAENGDLVPDKGLCSIDNLTYTNKEFGNSMVFRWRLEKSYEKTLDQQIDQQTVSSANPSSPAPAADASAAPTGDAQALAKQLIDLASKGKVKYNVLNAADKNDDSTPQDNIQDTADGKPAQTTSNCSGRGAQPPKSSVNLNTDLLKFLVELAQKQTITINALAGQCHGSPTSNHYKGVAVDFQCPFDPTNADKIGSKYNISDGTGETCATSPPHYHYSVGGH